jgi:hypothetical protein
MPVLAHAAGPAIESNRGDPGRDPSRPSDETSVREA